MIKRQSVMIKDVPKNAFETAKRLFKELKNQKFRLTIVIIFVVISTVLNVFTPYYSARIIDLLFDTVKRYAAGGIPFSIQWNPLGKGLTAMTALYLSVAILNYFQSLLMASVAEKLILTLREQISAKLHKLPLEFYDNNKRGEILSKVTNDLDKISETLQTGLLKFVVSIGTVVGSLAFMFYFSPSLTMIFLGFAAVSFVATKIVANKNLAFSADRQEKIAVLTGVAEEQYTGRDAVKAYNNEKNSEKILNDAIEDVAKASKKTDFLTHCVDPVITLLLRFAQACILLIACLRMMKGDMSFGVAQAYFRYTGLCSDPLTEASFMINSLQSAFASAERTFGFLDEREEVPDVALPFILHRARGLISFKNVSFGYTPDKILMRNVSFTAEEGQKIAIVGPTGAGKTTLVNLLMRFYEANDGKIKIDGVLVTDLTRKNLRSNFGMVLQDTWLFGGTIAENIAYGKENATREEIERAAKTAGADYFIRTLPQGYDTVIGSDAANMSAGQRQLLTIARVFLRDPPVLILDEATSSVDTRTEAEIGKAMKSLMRGRTSFVIAHRLSTVRDADNILFMENGNIIEQGNHEALLKKGGAYARLYNSQFL